MVSVATQLVNAKDYVLHVQNPQNVQAIDVTIRFVPDIPMDRGVEQIAIGVASMLTVRTGLVCLTFVEHQLQNVRMNAKVVRMIQNVRKVNVKTTYVEAEDQNAQKTAENVILDQIVFRVNV